MNLWIEVAWDVLISIALLVFCGWGLTAWLLPRAWDKYQYIVAPFAGLFLIDSISHLTSVLGGWGGKSSIWIVLVASAVLSLAAVLNRRSLRWPNRTEWLVAICALPALLLALYPVCAVGEMLPVGDTNADPISHTTTSDFLQFNGTYAPVPEGSEHPAYVPAFYKLRYDVRLGFHFFQMYVNILTGRSSYETFPIVSAVGLYLWCWAVWFVAKNTLRLPQAASLGALVLFALNGFPLWIAYGGFGPQVLGMGLLVLAFGCWAAAIQDPSIQTGVWAAMMSSALAGIYAEALPYLVAPIGLLVAGELVGLERDRILRVLRVVAVGILASAVVGPIGWIRALSRVLLVTSQYVSGNVDWFIDLRQIMGLIPFLHPRLGQELTEVFSGRWTQLLWSLLFVAVFTGLYAIARLRSKERWIASSFIVAHLGSLTWFLWKDSHYGYFKGWSMGLFMYIILVSYGFHCLYCLLAGREGRRALQTAIVALFCLVLCMNGWSSVSLARSMVGRFACKPGIAQLRAYLKELDPTTSLYVSAGNLSRVSVFWVAYFVKDHPAHFDTQVIYTSNPPSAYQEGDWLLLHKSSEFRLDEDTYKLTKQWETNEFELWEVDRHRVFETPAIQHLTQAELGGMVRLLGYDADLDDLRAGDTLELVLYWQPLVPIEESYKVFVHFLDPSDQVWGQVDSYPVGWTYFTNWWEPREVVADGYEVPIRADAPPGEYVLQAGMYLEGSGERLPVVVDGTRDPHSRIVVWEGRLSPPEEVP